jgi:CubicO group peptidase (beta-lactamase class C family)
MTGIADPKSAGLDIEALSRLDASIQRDIDNGENFGASIIVARSGVIGHRRTFGIVAPERAAADDDRYLLMSLSKSFNALLVLRAIDHGRFTLDTRIADVIPAFAAGGKQRVTVRQLLNHTGGVWSGLLPPPPCTPADFGNLAKSVAAICAQLLAYTPGTRCAYAPGAGHAVLAQMLVDTDPAGRSYRDIAREELFAPLGMADTSFGLSKADPHRVPISYTDKRRSPTSAVNIAVLESLDETAETPGAGAYGTAEDVFRFADALRMGGDNGDYRILSRSLIDYARRNHTGDMANDAVTSLVEAEGRPEFRANMSLMGGYVRGDGHHLSGAGFTASPEAFYGVGGSSTMFMVDPQRDLTVVFLSAGFIDGLAHFDRISRLNDLALAACE